MRPHMHSEVSFSFPGGKYVLVEIKKDEKREIVSFLSLYFVRRDTLLNAVFDCLFGRMPILGSKFSVKSVSCPTYILRIIYSDATVLQYLGCIR